MWPSREPRACLYLEVDEWPANTRLYKAVDQSGLQIDCRPPQKKGKSKEIDEAAMAKWIVGLGQVAARRWRSGIDAAQQLLD